MNDDTHKLLKVFGMSVTDSEVEVERLAGIAAQLSAGSHKEEIAKLLKEVSDRSTEFLWEKVSSVCQGKMQFASNRKWHSREHKADRQTRCPSYAGSADLPRGLVPTNESRFEAWESFPLSCSLLKAGIVDHSF